MFRVASSAKSAVEEARYLRININHIEQRFRKPSQHLPSPREADREVFPK